MRDEGFSEVGAHLDDAYAGLGLRVWDVEARAAGIVQADVADTQVAQLAVADAAVAEDARDERAARVRGADDRHPAGVPVDCRLRAAESRRDRVLAHAAREHLRDPLRGVPPGLHAPGVAVASCAAAASISARSSSSSRKLRCGLGTRTRMRLARAGLRSM